MPFATLHAADDGDRDVVEVGRRTFMRRLDDPGDELRPVAGVVELVVLVVELLDRLLLVAEHLDDRVTGVHLLDVAVERAGPLPLGGELLLRPLGDEHRDDHRDRHDEQRDDREQRADREHHDQHADDREDRGDELGQALLERLADVVDVVGDAGQDVAAGLAVEVGERQPASFSSTPPAQPVDGPLRDAGHDVGLAPAEDELSDVEQRRRGRGSRPSAAKSMPDAGPHVGMAGEHVGELTSGPCARSRATAWSWVMPRSAGTACRRCHALEDDVGGVAEDLGPDDRAGRR